MFDFVVKYFSPLKHIPFLPHIFDSLAGLFAAIANKNIPGYIDEVQHAAEKWEGISTSQHKYGGLQFNYQNKELGHIHSNGLLDIYFPKKIRNELISEKKAQEHHVFKNSGWISFYMRKKEHTAQAISLLRMAYEFKNSNITA